MNRKNKRTGSIPESYPLRLLLVSFISLLFFFQTSFLTWAADDQLRDPTMHAPDVYLKEDVSIEKKPWYKKWWVWGLVVLAAGAGGAAVVMSDSGGGDEEMVPINGNGTIKIHWETE